MLFCNFHKYLSSTYQPRAPNLLLSPNIFSTIPPSKGLNSIKTSNSLSAVFRISLEVINGNTTLSNPILAKDLNQSLLQRLLASWFYHEELYTLSIVDLG